MSNPIISVVIPTRNRAPYLKRTLDALLQDDYPDKEIIVCDGASTDGTTELLKGYGTSIRWISEPDKGEYDARNKGMGMATGELFRYLNDDDEPIHGAFAFAANYFQSHPEVDILFGQGDLVYTRYGVEPFLVPTPARTLDSITVKNFIQQRKPAPLSESAFFRRRVIEQVGLFSLDYIVADNEYWIRCAKAGLIMDICNKKFIRYYYSDVSAGVRGKGRKMMLGKLRIVLRHGNTYDFLYVFFTKALSLVVHNALSGILHCLGIYPTVIRTKRRSTCNSKT